MLFEKFSAMVERAWDGIAAHCGEEEKVCLGFAEGLSTKIRVIQRRVYGSPERGIFAPQDPHLYAARDLHGSQSTHSIMR